MAGVISQVPNTVLRLLTNMMAYYYSAVSESQDKIQPELLDHFSHLAVLETFLMLQREQTVPALTTHYCWGSCAGFTLSPCQIWEDDFDISGVNPAKSYLVPLYL
eukprot:scaffold11515_cov72-Attheya_sp.AAC.1